MQQRHLKFGEWLRRLDLIAEAALEAALARQQSEPGYIGELLIAAGEISEAVRDNILSLQKLLGSSTRLADLEVAPDTLRRIPTRVARDSSVLPLLLVEDWLVVAMPQSDDLGLLEELAQLTGLRIYPVPYRAADIQEATQQAYHPRRARQAGMEWIHDEMPGSGPLLTFVGCGDALGSGARNQTCLHLRSEDATFLIDCGPTSLTALKYLGLPLSQLDGILLTHAHGDHFGGVPFVLLEQQEQGRTRPLWIMAAPHLIETVKQWNSLCYAGLFDRMGYELRWIEIEHEPRSVPGTGVMVYPFAMEHQKSRLCLGYQIHLPEEKIVAYTGDTAWNDNLELLARDTDLFVCECSYFDPAPEGIKHLSYQELSARRDQLKTRHLILTHMSANMLQKVSDGAVAFDTAYDGLTVDLGVKV
ncbi:MAG TPA: MBL fold metallo-hydrolase [Candidatus Obscuribacterales bacterium]